MARRVFAAAAALAAASSLPGASSLFSTTLHGAPTEVVEPGTPGVATMELQPWLTTVDPAARARARRRFPAAHARSRGSCDAARTRAASLRTRRARRLRTCASGWPRLPRARNPSSGMPGPYTLAPAQAVCNDGTPAGYYYKEGLPPAACDQKQLASAAKLAQCFGVGAASYCSPRPLCAQAATPRSGWCTSRVRLPASDGPARCRGSLMPLCVRAGAHDRRPRQAATGAGTSPAARSATARSSLICAPCRNGYRGPLARADLPACTIPSAIHRSSSGWGKLFAQDGIFSTVQANNPFANANMVFLKCVPACPAHQRR